jgi:hypothetical protein
MREIRNSSGKVVRIEISDAEIETMGEREFIDFVMKNGELLPHQLIDSVVTPRMERYFSQASDSASDILKTTIAGLPFLIDSMFNLVKHGMIEIDDVDIDCLQYCIDKLNEARRN